MMKLQLFNGEQWIDVKGITEIKPPKIAFKPVECLTVNILPDDHFIHERGCMFEDKDWGWAGYYNFVCSLSDWANQGGE